jgi:hypothetical protein
LFQWATREPIATLAYWAWAKAQQAGPIRQPSSSPRGAASTHGAVSHGVAEVHRQQGLHHDHPHGSGYKPQHRDLEKVARERVITGEAVRAATTDGVEGGNNFQVGEGAPSPAS